jgi:hypothetical protein
VIKSGNSHSCQVKDSMVTTKSFEIRYSIGNSDELDVIRDPDSPESQFHQLISSLPHGANIILICIKNRDESEKMELLKSHGDRAQCERLLDFRYGVETRNLTGELVAQDPIKFCALSDAIRHSSSVERTVDKNEVRTVLVVARGLHGFSPPHLVHQIQVKNQT